MNNEEDPALETVLKMASEKGLGMMLIIMPAKNTALFSKHKFFLFPIFWKISVYTTPRSMAASNTL